MPYVIDANCFIQAKNLWYQPSFHPGFWKWLETQNEYNLVLSVNSVYEELVCAGSDDCLSKWAKGNKSFFKDDHDQGTMDKYQLIVNWAQHNSFKKEGIDHFLDGADPWIAAYACAHGHILVSHESEYVNMAEIRNIRLARVCKDFGIKYQSLFTVIQNSGVKFII